MGLPATGSSPRSTLYVKSDGYRTVRESTTPPISLADLYKTMDAAAVDHPRGQSVLHACRKQINVPLDSTSCFLSVENTLRGSSGHDRTYTCETSGHTGNSLFILNRMTRGGEVYATWIKNYGDSPSFDLNREYQIAPEISGLLEKEIYTKNNGSSCIVSFTNSIYYGSKQAAMRSGNCAFTWRLDEDTPTIKKLGKTCQWDSPGSDSLDFLKIPDESQQGIETQTVSLQQEQIPSSQVDSQLPESANQCECPEVICPQLLGVDSDFSRIYVAALGAAASYLGYRAYQAAKDILYPTKINDEQVEETGQSLDALRNRQSESCKKGLSAWLPPVGFGVASVLCLGLALKA